MTKWLVTGAEGMLGREVTAALSGRDLTALGHDKLDITDAPAVAREVARHDVVVNCAAWTDVDGAEANEEAAFAANAIGPARLAEACRRSGARLVHVSTDYVFDGETREPYPTDAMVQPLSVYGRTKAAGEWAVRAAAPEHTWLVRTAWMFGRRENGFVPAMLRLARQGRECNVIDDAYGQPTWARHMAHRLIELVDAGAPVGTYHSVSSGLASWFDFARAIFESAGADPQLVKPVPSSTMPRPAPRPMYSALENDRCWQPIGLPPLPDWQVAWKTASAELTATVAAA